MNVSITATRRILNGDRLKISQALAALPPSKLYVGGCRGGDCEVARLALMLRHQVHTVIPGEWAQLCVHWKGYLYKTTNRAPHTTSWEQMPESDEPYRRRNERLVELGPDLLLAFPDKAEQQPRSGVTMTINIARRAGVEVLPKILHGAT
jgi:hypothetical protein